MSQLAQFKAILLFFTRIPARCLGRLPDSEEPIELSAALPMVPLAGALIGLAGGAVALIASLPFSGSLIPAILAVATMMLLTGALHEDGLADMADSLAGQDRAKRLDILRDSRLGTYGASALVLSLLLRVALISALLAAAGALAALLCLIAAHAWSRAASFWLPYHLAHARSGGAAVAFGRPTWPRLRQALLAAGLIVMLTAASVAGVIATLLASLLAFLVPVFLADYCERRYGGQTGDLIGAMQQLCELCFLLTIVATL